MYSVLYCVVSSSDEKTEGMNITFVYSREGAETELETVLVSTYYGDVSINIYCKSS